MSSTTYDRLVLAKTEATKGLDAAPVPANDAVRVRSVNITTNTNNIDRPVVKQTMGMLPHQIGKQTIQAEIVLEMRGAGSAGSVPEWGPLMEACRMAQTINAGVSVVYLPSSAQASEKSATVYVYKDGLLWKLVGAVGDAKFDAQADGIVLATFTLQAPYTAPTVVAVPAGAVFDNTQPLLMTNTSVMNDGADIKVGQFGLVLGNDVQHHYVVNDNQFTVAGRNPSITISKDSVNTAAEWTALTAGSSVALTSQFGATGGNIVAIAAPAMRRRSIAYAERAERDTLSLTYGLYESTSDDQVSVTVK